MGYFKRIEGEIVNCDEALPADIEAVFEGIRENYSVEYRVSDWADDDTDSGMGYCYDNSFRYYREPYRDELIIEDGRPWGFCFRKSYYDTIYIALSDAGSSVDKYGHNTRRYGDSTSWTLVKESSPLKARYIYAVVDEKNEKKKFIATDFPAGLIKGCVKRIGIEDKRGHYDGSVRLWLELTDKAAKDIDATLGALRKLDKVRCAVPVKKY